MIQVSNLSAAWIKYYQEDADDEFWALEKLNELTHSNPDNAWVYIKEIFQLCSLENILRNLAAGPLEDLLLYHGDKFIEEIEILSRQNPAFAKVIKEVCTGEMSNHIQNKITDIKVKYGNAL